MLFFLLCLITHFRVSAPTLPRALLLRTGFQSARSRIRLLKTATRSQTTKPVEILLENATSSITIHATLAPGESARPQLLQRRPRVVFGRGSDSEQGRRLLGVP